MIHRVSHKLYLLLTCSLLITSVWGSPVVKVGAGEKNSLAKGSLTHDLITRAGGINIAKDEPVPFPILFQEFIIEKDPDIIIVEEWGTTPSTVKGRDGWKNIKAVKSDRILVSKNGYTGYTPRCLDGLDAYARFFHPGLFDK